MGNDMSDIKLGDERPDNRPKGFVYECATVVAVSIVLILIGGTELYFFYKTVFSMPFGNAISVICQAGATCRSDIPRAMIVLVSSLTLLPIIWFMALGRRW